jgi:long-chain acyl-CoA synthetase
MLGYYKNEKTTKETIRNGWLHTGDMGYVDSDGFLYVLGRFKSLLISDDGEKYSPEGIEETMTYRSPYIDQMMLYNNQNKYTSAIIVPNREALLKWAKNNNIDLKESKGHEALLLEMESVIRQYKEGGAYADLFPSRWLPAAVAIVSEPFTADNTLLNSLGKMVRAKIADHFLERINHMNTENLKAVRKILNID